MNQRLIYRLDDNVIAHVAKILQLAFVTQTDITDHMRQIVLEPSKDKSGSLVLTPEYKEKVERDIQRMLDDALEAMEKAERV